MSSPSTSGLQARPSDQMETSSTKGGIEASEEKQSKLSKKKQKNYARKKQKQREKKLAKEGLEASPDGGDRGEAAGNGAVSQGLLIIDGNKLSPKAAEQHNGDRPDAQGSRSSVDLSQTKQCGTSAPRQAVVAPADANATVPDSPASSVTFPGHSQSQTPQPASSAPPPQPQHANGSPFVSHGIIFGKDPESDESTLSTPYYGYYGHPAIQHYQPHPYPSTQYGVPNIVFHYPAGANTYPNAYTGRHNPAAFYPPGPLPTDTQDFPRPNYAYSYGYPGSEYGCREPCCRDFDPYPSRSTGPSVMDHDKSGRKGNWSLPDDSLLRRQPLSEKDFDDSTDTPFDTPTSGAATEHTDTPQHKIAAEKPVEPPRHASPERLQFQHDMNPENAGEMEPVSHHLLRMYKSGELADYKLILSSSSGRFHTSYFPLHKLVALRSPMLTLLMEKTPGAERGPQSINAVAAGNLLQSFSMDIALQNLYGLPLVDGEHFETPSSADTAQSTDDQKGISSTINSAAQMEFFLSYIAAGSFLANGKIFRRGAKLAMCAINWDSMAAVLHFGLSPIDFMVAPVDRELEGDCESSTIRNESIADPHDTEAEDNGLENASEKRDSFLAKGTLNQELQDVWAPKLLQETLAFIASHLPPDFQLDTHAETIFLPDISPATDLANGMPQSRMFLPPHISHVKFGDFGCTRDSLANRDTTLASSIFVSLPFKTLKELFNTMKINGSFTARLAVQVVVERETRRLRALRAMNMKRDGTEICLCESDPLGWKESLSREASNSEDGISFHRSWTGLEAPAFVAGG